MIPAEDFICVFAVWPAPARFDDRAGDSRRCRRAADAPAFSVRDGWASSIFNTPSPLHFVTIVVMGDLGGAITRLIQDIEAGDANAADRLLEAVYDELRILAAARLRRDRPGQTLDPTALVHEAYLRLVGADGQPWNSRGHFFAAAAEAMRRILIERARRKLADKHGSGRNAVPLDGEIAAAESESKNLLILNQALASFEMIDEEKAALVKLRHFAGLSEQQAADALGISRATAARHWAYARAWLYDEIQRLQGL